MVIQVDDPNYRFGLDYFALRILIAWKTANASTATTTVIIIIIVMVYVSCAEISTTKRRINRTKF